MQGFLEMPLADFSAWNTIQTAAYVDLFNDPSCTSYTYYLLDEDPLKCWARVEHGRLPGDEEDEQLFIVGDIKTEEEAINLGMIIPQE